MTFPIERKFGSGKSGCLHFPRMQKFQVTENRHYSPLAGTFFPIDLNGAFVYNSQRLAFPECFQQGGASRPDNIPEEAWLELNSLVQQTGMEERKFGKGETKVWTLPEQYFSGLNLFTFKNCQWEYDVEVTVCYFGQRLNLPWSRTCSNYSEDYLHLWKIEMVFRNLSSHL